MLKLGIKCSGRPPKMQIAITQIINPMPERIQDVDLYQVRTLVQYSAIIARESTESHIVSAIFNLALSTRSGFSTTGNDSSSSSSLSFSIALTLLRLFFSGPTNYAVSASAHAFNAINTSSSTMSCSLWLWGKENNLSLARFILGVLVEAVLLLCY